MGFAILVLLVPVFCPMLYFCLVRSERQASETGKWALTTVVFASVVAAVGLALPNPYLALAGIAGVVFGAGTLMWLLQAAIERSSDPT